MAKKKKVWKSVALSRSNMREADKIRSALVSIARGELDDEPLVEVFRFMSWNFEKIQTLESDAEIMEMIVWLMNCYAYFDDESDENDEKFYNDVQELFDDAVALFAEKAKTHENREYVMDLMHDMFVSSVDEEARLNVFYEAHEFLSVEEMRRVGEMVLSSVMTHAPGNEKEILSGLLAMADGANDPVLYEKAAFRKDPERTNGTLVEVANAYYVADDLPNARRLLGEVKNPEGSDEEGCMDLKVGLLFKEEKEKEAIELAESLYEKYPKEAHLMSLCKVVSPARKEELLDSHEKFRLGDQFSSSYGYLLVALDEWDRITRYLDCHAKEIPMANAYEREVLADYLKKSNRGDLAEKLQIE